MKHTLRAGTGEIMQYAVHGYNDNTIRFILRYPGTVDAEAMRQAVRAVVFSVDVLHASFQPGRLRARWKVNPEMAEENFFTCLQVEDPWETAVARALEPVSPDGACQLRCALVRSTEESLLVVSISHLCADGIDGKYLLGKLTEAYGRIRSGDEAGLKVKNGSRAAEQIYERLSRREMRTLMHSPLGGVKTEFPYPTGEHGEPRLTLRMIPAGVMASARRRAKAEQASVNDLLLAACYQAFAQVAGLGDGTPVSVMGMMDLRKHCIGGDSAGLCNMSGSLCTTLREGVAEDLAQTLARVARQTRAAKEEPLAGLVGMPLVHGAARILPMSVLLRCVGRLYGSFSIGLTNLGSIDCEALALDGLKPTAGVFGGPVKKKPGMQVSAASFDGACTLCVAGQYTREDALVLRSLLDGMAEHIARYAENA
ncbi:MAG: hypothetical protein E7316_07505 [Clostridiales bacterium]|nr:hypothetical protein [Clostridiales bacterium]